MSGAWRRALTLTLAACAALLVASSAASADWRTIPAPGGQIWQMVVADADTWLAEVPGVCCTPTYDVTKDQGAHWTPVQVPGFDFAQPAGATADGSFRVLAWTTGFEEPKEARVFRITPEGGVEPLGPAIETETAFFNERAAVSEDGVTWVPFQDDKGAHRLALVGSDGSSSIVTPPDGPTPTVEWRAQRTALGVRLLRYASEGSFPIVFAREAFRLEGGDLVPAESHPVEYADGELLIGSNGSMSWDGGAHWASHRVVSPVPRAPGLGMPRYMTPPGGGIAEQVSPSLFAKTGLVWPAGVPTNHVVDAGRALVAWGTDNLIHVHEGPFPPLPRALGQLEPDTRAMLDRADQFRADAGLPPLTGSALISQAARNHSRYTFLNPDAAKEGAHYEFPGKPGFTGYSPGERCEAVGTACNSEIAYSPEEPDPVGGWLATPFHRPLIATPMAGIAGAGQVDGGWSIMNAWAEEQNVLVRPFGYPNGRWRGSEGFAGETPDPVSACQSGGQPIEYPVGIAVTLFVPADFSWNDAKVSRIEVRKAGSADPLAGCLLEDMDPYGGTTGILILDDPLVEGQTYHARGEWYTGSDWSPAGVAVPGTTLSHEWSFTFQPDDYGLRKAIRRCRGVTLERFKSSARQDPPSRRGLRKGLQATLLLSHPAAVRLRRASFVFTSGRGTRRNAILPLGKLRGRTLSLGRRSRLALRLPRGAARRLPLGEEVSLRIVFSAQRTSGCTQQARFSSRLKARVGWARLKGPVAWVSLERKKQRRSG